MKALAKITFVDENNEKIFGEGPYRLLKGVEEKGSLRATAMDMGMSYTKALKIINNAEEKLGFKFITRLTGGKSGGGSCLTEEGLEWLKKYEEFKTAYLTEFERLYNEYYGKC